MKSINSNIARMKLHLPTNKTTTRMKQADDIFNLAFWQSLHSHCIFIRWLPRTNSGYVWGQRINYLKNLMMASLKEQTKDLTTCSICLETFNEGRLKPKFLPCGHTFCLKCTKVNSYHYWTLMIILCYSTLLTVFSNYNEYFLCFRQWQPAHRRIDSTVLFAASCACCQEQMLTVFQTICMPCTLLKWTRTVLDMKTPFWS